MERLLMGARSELTKLANLQMELVVAEEAPVEAEEVPVEAEEDEVAEAGTEAVMLAVMWTPEVEDMAVDPVIIMAAEAGVVAMIAPEDPTETVMNSLCSQVTVLPDLIISPVAEFRKTCGASLIFI